MTGSVWFVTGSSRGLGRAVVDRARAAGHRVVATARNVSALDRFADDDAVLPLPLDVTDPDAVERAVAAAVDRFGRVDVVVNNAGYADLAPVEGIDLDAFRAQVDAVFLGTVYVSRAVVPIMRAQGSGLILQVGSIGGRLTAAGTSAYQSAKFAVEGFSSVLAQEVGGFGVRVVVAEPGAMRTDWAGSSMATPELDPAYEDTVGRTIRGARASSGVQPIDPERVAEVFVRLAAIDDPPLHLVLGTSAVDNIRRVTAAQAVEDARWAPLGRAVDFASPSSAIDDALA